MFRPEITVLVESEEHPPTTMADCVSRALRAEHRVNQSREECIKLYEARKAVKRQELVGGRNEKFNSKGRQIGQGNSNKRKGNN